MTHFHWQFKKLKPQKLSTFLFKQGITKALMKGIKFHGGKITVNQQAEYTNYMVQPGDLIKVTLPPEPSNPNVLVSHQPIHVQYENKNYLIVDKPIGISSVPSKKYYRDTLINRVKGYYYDHHYHNLEMHIVTRLDRVTSGLVIFAKNHFAHSVLDYELKRDLIVKKYYAIVEGRMSVKQGAIVLPIGQDPTSLIKRKVESSGRYARTDFKVVKMIHNLTLLRIRLKTGRTHQIRVHFDAIGHPLVGDWLYNPTSKLLKRLALHCYKISFYDWLDKLQVTCISQMPSEMRNLIR